MDIKGIELKISEDKYQATISIKENSVSLESEVQILNLLKNKGIVYGINKEAVNAIVKKSKENTGSIENMLIAEGIRPFEGVKPKIELNFEINTKPKENEKGQVDYREISSFIKVKEGDLLARKRKLKEPINGITITGEKTQFPPIGDIPFECNNNVNIIDQEDYLEYRAGINGALRFNNNRLNVSRALEIKRNVDFNIGNIDFDGDVKIDRDVLPDFKVKTTGNIDILGSAIGCMLSAGEDIRVNSGIVGKDKGVISGQNISASFVENAKLEAEESINIKNGIIGTEVLCKGVFLSETERSKVINSSVKANKKIDIYDAGSNFDKDTSLTTGIIDEKEKEYNQLNKEYKKVIRTSESIEKKYGKSALQNKTYNRRLNSAEKDYTTWRQLNNLAEAMLKKLNKIAEEMYDYDSEIVVRGTIYPRVKLKIGEFEMVCSKEYHKVVIRYNKEEENFTFNKI